MLKRSCLKKLNNKNLIWLLLRKKQSTNKKKVKVKGLNA